jgi:hypothetical protein
MVHTRSLSSHHSLLSIWTTIAPGLLSRHRKIRCCVCLARRWQLASRQRTLQIPFFLSLKRQISLGPTIPTASVTSNGAKAVKLRTAPPTAPMSCPLLLVADRMESCADTRPRRTGTEGGRTDGCGNCVTVGHYQTHKRMSKAILS